MKHFKYLVILIKSFFPTKLPYGVNASHEEWLKDLVLLVGPIASATDIRATSSVAITHLGPTVDRKPLRYFAKCIRAGAAKQVAFHTFQEIKNEQARLQQEAVALEEQKKAAEATAKTEVSAT